MAVILCFDARQFHAGEEERTLDLVIPVILLVIVVCNL